MFRDTNVHVERRADIQESVVAHDGPGVLDDVRLVVHEDNLVLLRSSKALCEVLLRCSYWTRLR